MESRLTSKIACSCGTSRKWEIPRSTSTLMASSKSGNDIYLEFRYEKIWEKRQLWIVGGKMRKKSVEKKKEKGEDVIYIEREGNCGSGVG